MENTKSENHFYQKSIKNVIVDLKTTVSGLTEEQVSERLEEFGPNKLPEAKRTPAIIMFLSQFKDPMLMLLLISSAISAYFQHYKDALGIFFATLLNAFLGFFEEFKSRNAVDALKKLSSQKARIIRNGEEMLVGINTLVPGDILVLSEGEKVPSDARLIESYSLRIDESALTGESVPVNKSIEPLKGEKDLCDRTNMVYMSTIVTAGRAIAVTTATGLNTEIGKIATFVAEEPNPTPLQRQIEDLAKKLGTFAVVVCVLFFIISMMKINDFATVFSLSVSLAVAAIPEGLPTVVTITLALGMRRMAKEQAIVKHLPAVETLGCTTVICSDKTGTLTHNKMTVREIFFNGASIAVTGDGYTPYGDFFYDEDQQKACLELFESGLTDEDACFIPINRVRAEPEDLLLLAEIAFLCNDSTIESGKALGDPTEASLKILGYKAGLDDTISKTNRRIDEIPFSSDIRYMLTVNEDVHTHKVMSYAKGAVDVIIEKCDRMLIQGKVIELDNKHRNLIHAMNDSFCKKALRVLALAYAEDNKKDDPNKLVFAGLVGMIDPPRGEVKDALAQCNEAGVRVVMITGDQKDTAAAIATELGICDENCAVLTGADLDAMDSQQVKDAVNTTHVFSRVSPIHKVQILEALKDQTNIVAMTGDGVNDAPALRRADIGVSMALTGTDVAKETADMVLADDNFATIVNAVKEGRTIYTNIRKFLRFQLTANVAALTLMFVATVLNMPAPLTAIQILLINIVMDGPPALALGLEPPFPEIMKQKPRDPEEKLLSGDLMFDIALYGFFIAGMCLIIFKKYLATGNYALAQTAVFATFVMFQLIFGLGCRTHKLSLFSIGAFSNRYLLGAIAGSGMLLLAVIFTPLAGVFNTTPLPAQDFQMLFVLSTSVFILTELRKAASRLAGAEAFE